MKLLLTSILFLSCLSVFSQTPKQFDQLFGEKKYDKAWEMAWAMTKADSFVAFGYGQVGRMYSYRGQYDSGIYYLQKAIDLDNDRTYISTWGYANMGYALVMKGERDNGIETLNKAIANNKTPNGVHYAMHILDSIGAPSTGQQKVKWTITKEELLKDIDIYGSGIEKNHVYPFSVISKKDFYAHLEKVKDTTNLNIDEMLVELMKVNAEIEDEHTSIGYKEPMLFPFRCHLFKEGIYIVSADDTDKNVLFSRVIAVNGMPIWRVVEKIALLIPDKNKRYIDYEAPAILSSPARLHGLHIAGNKESVVLTLVTDHNDTLSKSFAAKKYFDISATRYDPDKMPLRYRGKGNYWYKYDSTGDFIYFRYASCFNDPAHPFGAFQESFFKELKDNNPKKVIIDIRDNGGGHTGVLVPFIDELSTSKYNKPHRIYVLTGRKTFSAAVNNLVYMHKALTITSIGEATGGSVNHYGAVESFPLPNTGMNVRFSTRRITGVEYANGPVKPNVVIEESIADYIEGIDAPLNYALADE